MRPKILRNPANSIRIIACWLAVCLGASVAGADNLKDAENYLCTGMQVFETTASGSCSSGPPWDYNLPSFVEIDLRDLMLRTTEASGENRSSPIKHLEREDGYVYLQGIENGRAYSAVIAVDAGLITFSIAADGRSIAVFGACTPQPHAD